MHDRVPEQLANDPSGRALLVSDCVPARDLAAESGVITFLPKRVDLKRVDIALDDAAQTLSSVVSPILPAAVAGEGILLSQRYALR